MNLKDVINLVFESVIQNKKIFNHQNLLLIGENNAGKSKFLKDSINNLLRINQEIYFIDSSNREVSSKSEEIIKTFDSFDCNNIVKERIKTNNFNKEDVFSPEDGNEIIKNELLNNIDKYNSLFKEIIDLNVEISRVESSLSDLETSNEILIGGNSLDTISNGIQAMTRITMETNFSYEKGIKTIVIDEINMNLDHNNSWKLIEKLKEKYTNIRWIITSHSLYTVLGIKDFDIIKINKNYTSSIEDNLCEIFDSNDFDNVEYIHRKLFENSEEKNDKDVMFSNITKKLISKINLTNFEEFFLKEIKIDSLNNRQKVIYKYILGILSK